MIEIKNVTKRFGDFTAIENINLTVEPSSIYGLVGYNGAGKTTLLKICSGIYKPEEGEVLLDSENVYDNGKKRAELFFVPDDVYFPRNATLEKMKKLYMGYYPSFDEKVYNNMRDALGLDEKKNIRSFSKGMQRQAIVILAMATRPKFLFLDEVFDGIDPQKRSLCKKIFIEYMAETGCSMIMSSHNLIELGDLCDKIALINGKHLTMNVSVDDISAAYVKYRLVLKDAADAEKLREIPNKGISGDGKLATIIVSSDVGEEAFASLNPIHIDSIQLSLEEVFLNEMEDKDYDIAKIFS
ncbi:MAG: ABC transporter ATP-binding protein [Eubacterium sp.]|nr:ABC transporter ATP-binding protein [Eubacterium sp.]